MRLGWWSSVAATVLLLACGPDEGRGGTGALSLGESANESGGSGEAGGSSGGDPTTSTSSTTDNSSTTVPTDSDDPPSAMDCAFPSTTFGAALQELDEGPGSSVRLTFTIPAVPPPADVQSATLAFESYDADHPGEEGLIYVNGSAPYQVPAMAAWDNAAGTGEIDVTVDIVEGDNVIEFGPGPLDRSFFGIGNVQLLASATVQECGEPPDPMAVERTVVYQDATYTERQNWVLRCDDYAFTARGDEHIPSDCDGLYAPDGNRTGTATFAFPDVAPSEYEIQIRSRHTTNRNPNGALFVVDGVGDRIFQNDNADYTTDIWGTATLSGNVDVVLDSTQEGESDSVIWVRLVPL